MFSVFRSFLLHCTAWFFLHPFLFFIVLTFFKLVFRFSHAFLPWTLGCWLDIFLICIAVHHLRICWRIGGTEKFDRHGGLVLL
jgi:hypothetical protein